MKKPKWMCDETTRSRSDNQESNIAKILKGRKTINSGATLGQNDVITDYCEVEAKITAKKQFSVHLKDIEKLAQKCDTSKIPIYIVEFENTSQSFALLPLDDLLLLINAANTISR